MGRGNESAPAIALLNDEFRRTTRDFLLTRGVQDLPDVLGLVQAVCTFDTFTEDNDPWGEHDFGSINWHNEKTFWKIDYYDQELKGWHDPLSPDCHRILTLMLAEEY